MQAQADTLPLAVERAGESRWRQAVARSIQDRRDLREVDEIGRDAYLPYDHRGLVIVASAWVAFYVVAAITNL